MITWYKRKSRLLPYTPFVCAVVVASCLIAYAVKHPVRVEQSPPHLERTSPIVFEGIHMTLEELMDYTVTEQTPYIIADYWYEQSKGESLRSNEE